MKALYLKAMERISPVIGIKYVDKDLGQLDRYEIKPSVPPFCALIKVEVLSTNDITDDEQICNSSITVRMWFDTAMNETSSLAPESAVNRSLSFDDIIEGVYNAMQGYKDRMYTPFKMKSCKQEERSDGMTVWKMIFYTSFYKKPVRL